MPWGLGFEIKSYDLTLANLGDTPLTVSWWFRNYQEKHFEAGEQGVYIKRLGLHAMRTEVWRLSIVEMSTGQIWHHLNSTTPTYYKINLLNTMDISLRLSAYDQQIYSDYLSQCVIEFIAV